MKLSIIIPNFNEQSTILKILEEVSNANLPKKIEKEIIVIDDGSKDSSQLKIKNSKLKGLKKIFHEKNMGKGAAIRSGLKVATGDYIIIQDADLEYDPSYYQKLFEPVLKNSASVVFGTRLLNYPLKFWGRDKTVLPSHLFANKFLTFMTNKLYNSKLTDMETGYKLIKRKILDGILIKSNRFDFEVEITAKILKKKIQIFEVPIKVNPRTYKQGKKIGWIDGLVAVWKLFKYRFFN